MHRARDTSLATGVALALLAASLQADPAPQPRTSGVFLLAQAPSGDRAPQTVPEMPGSASPGGSLSNKLDRSGGVIQPPANVDPGLTQPTPAIGGNSTPVIPPPGTPGGNPAATPK
ncbi:MAG: hypothetical protein JO267_12425 [Alphaproteobacteria bacterium]|nr:hypothetical protein [Alphaproteobacteria bacterium]